MAKKWVPLDPRGIVRLDLAADSKRRAWLNVGHETGGHFRHARKAGWAIHHLDIVYE